MAGEHPLRDLLHAATHRVPGAPAHVEHPAGHQGRTNRPHRPQLNHRNPNSSNRINHPARPPKVLIAWQRRIAALFGQWI